MNADTLTTVVLETGGADPDISQTDLFRHVLNDTTFGLSLYVNIALAGVALLLFLFLARNLRDPRSQLIVVSVMAASAVSIASYSGLASGLTLDIIQMPEGHALAETTTVLEPGGDETDGTIVMWGRALGWAVSMPFILLALGLLAGSNITKIATAIGSTTAAMLMVMVAALTTSNYLFRWWWYALGVVFFLVTIYILLVEWPEDAKAAGTSDIVTLVKWITVITLFGFFITWALGTEGTAVIESVTLTSWIFSVLDIAATYIVGLLVVLWTVNNTDIVSGGRTYGATSDAIPAD